MSGRDAHNGCMTMTPVQPSDGLPSVTTPVPAGAPQEGNSVHEGDHPALDVLDAYRQEAGLSHQELWLGYFERGGSSKRSEVEAILSGALVTSDHDHDIIALTLNERFAELDMGHPVPYATEQQHTD
jgi:hypothetical protein